MASLGSRRLRIFAANRSFSNFIVLKKPSEFDAVKKSTSKKILYFTATWCPPCRAIAPIFEKLSKVHANIDFVKIDIDALESAATEYGIRSVPTFVLLHGTNKIQEFSGADEARLSKCITELEMH